MAALPRIAADSQAPRIARGHGIPRHRRFGRHGVLHEQHFFELAGDLTVMIEFVLTNEEAERLLELIRREKIRLFHFRIPVEFGVINAGAGEAAV